MVNILMRAKTILLLASFFFVLIILNAYFVVSPLSQFIPLALFLLYLKARVRLNAKKRLIALRKGPFIFDSASHSQANWEDKGLTTGDIERIKSLVYSRGEAVLAEIDQDGFFLRKYPLNIDVPLADESSFLKRHKYKISLVALPSGLAIKKEYHHNYITFANELTALKTLGGTCNAPSLRKIDFDRNILYISYIPGMTLRDMIAGSGARILDRHNKISRDHQRESDNQRWLKRVAEGKKYVRQVIDESMIDLIYDKVSEIHSHGVCLYDIKYGNILVEEKTKEPYFVDFENCILFDNSKGILFKIIQRYDLYLLDLHFR